MKHLSPSDLTSRFILESDPFASEFVFPLPSSWWSRPYEYQWCSAFAEADDIVLDAACGISHPFKFYLAQHCKQTYACDWDPLISSFDNIVEGVRTDISEEAAKLVDSQFRSRIHLQQASLTELPYGDRLFDKIFCVSVMEHLSPSDALLAMHEFHRTLKDDGLIVMTLDYPTVDFAYFQLIMMLTGLEFVGSIDTTLPANVLYTEQWGGLSCFRVLLKKRSAS
ncbi:bifunctional 2-polyprenyl-6-hydroxyphenol methylase/3-demethylubiquinol 3-O-methyltransferase UbiG [Paenibacillus sp. CF384]|uniref:class I SAM-dependent methyltransferase n=1 Tax=Paenibacillus sp. CF384 TaxID=1884382 RepID=UPI0008950D93|nr:class I SAM-dependent methyltransferase [Paenibacillus sp. CF384]SDW20008.1 Methyltransferase domain-containing protein [Paenibacillus sp. CF384]